MTRGNRAPYIPSQHSEIMRITLRFDKRDPEHRKIVAYLNRLGMADNKSVRSRKLIEVGYRAMQTERRLARALRSEAAPDLGDDE